ncbi:MAG: YihY/virulence factor BrkB family protein [Chthonomonadales bacterium]
MKLAQITPLLKEAGRDWMEDKAPRLAAAFSYYTLFSLAPLLIIIVAIAGIFFGPEAATGQLAGQIENAVGPETAKVIQSLVVSASKPSAGIMATIIGTVTLIFGAMAVFGQLQDGLNTIWGVVPRPGRGFWEMIRERLLTFALVLGAGLLLLGLVLVNVVLTSWSHAVGSDMPGMWILTHIFNLVLSFGVITLLFAMIYRILPDVEILWSDVWGGAILASLLFALGKWFISLYLSVSSTGSAYGASGSLVVLLLWIYYSAQILFFGAEFTKVYAKKMRKNLKPADNADFVTNEMRVEEGLAPK